MKNAALHHLACSTSSRKGVNPKTPEKRISLTTKIRPVSSTFRREGMGGRGGGHRVHASIRPVKKRRSDRERAALCICPDAQEGKSKSPLTGGRERRKDCLLFTAKGKSWPKTELGSGDRAKKGIVLPWLQGRNRKNYFQP